MNMREFLKTTLMESQLSELEAEKTLGRIETRIGRATLENFQAPEDGLAWRSIIQQLLKAANG